MITRKAIIEAALTWTGTPYKHQHSTKGAGADCLGLVRGVYRDVYGFEPEVPPPYSPSWDEVDKTDAMMAAAGRHLVHKRNEPFAPGDVLVFRMARQATAKHCAIVIAPDRMLHARQGASVCQAALVPYWKRRIAGVFMFPGAV